MFRKITIPSMFLLPTIILIGGALQVSGASMSSEITVTNWDFDEYQPDAAYNSVRDEYFVVWYDNYPTAMAVMGARYTAAGVHIDSYVIAYETDPVRDNFLASVAYDPGNDEYFVVWTRDYYGDGSDYDIYGRYVPWDGPDGGHAAFPINTAPGHQLIPRVAYGGTVQEYMVTWWNESPAGSAGNIAAQRLAAGGLPQGNSFIVTSHATEVRVSPDIAYNQARNEYIIAYQRGQQGPSDIYGVRLSAAGGILGGGDFAIANWQDPETSPRIAASRVSNTWAVTWQSQQTPGDNNVYACLLWVDGTGAMQVGGPVNPGNSAFDESFPNIGVHPESSNYLIAWQFQYTLLAGQYGIDAQVFTAAGALKKVFVPRPLFIGETTNCSFPAVAGGVEDWMVVWQHGRDGTPTYEDIHGRVLFDVVFADGFESNNTNEWSSTAP